MPAYLNAPKKRNTCLFVDPEHICLVGQKLSLLYAVLAAGTSAAAVPTGINPAISTSLKLLQNLWRALPPSDATQELQE